ncbi:MAG: glycosyltransferase [Zhengella sp.]|uniref:glycosyltransferase n=1 Tax=Zhengella sp. TaxID=2282762 RepID=UPI0035294211|nr:glycosyltransferase [Brucellaceae bacterium]
MRLADTGPGEAARLHPESVRLVGIFSRAGIAPRDTVALMHRAARNGTTIQREFLASPSVDDVRYFHAMASELGLAFTDHVEPDRLIHVSGGPAALSRPPHEGTAYYRGEGGAVETLVSPDISDLPTLQALRQAGAERFSSLTVVAPGRLREALLKRYAGALRRRSTGRLFAARPDLSARLVSNTWQSFAAGLLAGGLPAGFLLAPQATLSLVHALSSLFFLSCLVLRALAIGTARTRRPAPLMPVDPALLPTYSVLVAAYREAAVVGELLVNLNQLRWPRSKLDIKIICEAGDEETLAAIHAHPLAGTVEVIVVPPGGPRTKPNALAYALGVTHGEFLVLYDAEDRPHPEQLLEAWQAFQAAKPDVACVQAPLFVRNGSANWLTSMFALEYAALFRGLLPWLARRGHFLPLGGTSNHFRRSVLDEVMGWDPYNVTEDADLGVRLVRSGYRATMIERPTLEDAPGNLGDWRGQRTRWLKGWMQCWLVHMRHPLRLARECGMADFLIVQVFLLGIVFCALVHPVIYGTVLLHLAGILDMPASPALGLWYLDMGIMLSAYAVHFFLGCKAMSPPERKRLSWHCLCLPLYWLMQSWAAWCALHELVRAPHYWAKTPHRPASVRPFPVFRGMPRRT